MSLKNLQRRCAAKLGEINAPQPFSLAALCQAVAHQRGRELYLHPLPPDNDLASPCGVLVALKDVDLVYYEPATSPLHQEHIILHELGHMIFDHKPITPLGIDTARLVPDLDPDVVQRVFGRTSYTLPQEREAEALASLVLESAARGNPNHHLPWPPPPPGVSDVLDRLSRLLGAASAGD